MAIKQNKIIAVWDKLPKEVKVGVYVVISGALTALIDYLKIIEVNDAIVLAVINIIIVLLNNRKQFVVSRLQK